MDIAMLIFLIYNIIFALMNIFQYVSYLKYRNFYFKLKYDNKYGDFKKKERITIDDKVFEILCDSGDILYLKEVRS